MAPSKNDSTALALSTSLLGGSESFLDALNGADLGATGVQDITSSTLTFSSTGTVPEPLTILGAATAVAFGAGFKRKLAKSKG